jgi:hypothetical protein
MNSSFDRRLKTATALIIMAFAVIIFEACTKEKEPAGLSSNGVTQLLIGDSTNFEITRDTNGLLIDFGRKTALDSASVDLFGNGIEDLRFIYSNVEEDSSYRFLFLKVLNKNVEIATETLIDTLFLCSTRNAPFDTLIHTSKSFFKRACEGKSNILGLLEVIESPLVFYENDPFNNEASWQTDDLTLITGISYNIPQTNTRYTTNRGLWTTTNGLDVQNGFLVFRVMREGERKLGWVKISTGFSGFEMHEFAMEK